MEEANVSDPFAKLAKLEVEEAQVSAERRRLQQQIDDGFGTDLAREREHELSLRRRELHLRIDALRASLGLPPGPTRRATDEPSLEKIWSLNRQRSRSNAWRTSASHRSPGAVTGWPAAVGESQLATHAERARSFNTQLRATAATVAGASADGHDYGFLCECGCDETTTLTLAEYDEQGGAWLDEGHRR